MTGLGDKEGVTEGLAGITGVRSPPNRAQHVEWDSECHGVVLTFFGLLQHDYPSSILYTRPYYNINKRIMTVI